MNMPKASSEKRDRWSETIQDVTNLLTKFVIPLYQDNRGRPSLLGTGFFVRANDYYFLVSAAHVLEASKINPIYFYVEPGVTRKLTGNLLLTRFQKNRDDDLVDVGVLKLGEESVPPYISVDKFAMDISYLKAVACPRAGKHYLILGFPASQSHVNPVERQVSTSPYGYRNRSIEDADYANHGVTPETHIVLPIDLHRSFDQNGKHRNFPKPQGMSGSPIWLLFDDLGGNEDRVFPVVGIGTRYRKKSRVIIGSDIREAKRMIDHHLRSR